MDNSPNLTLPYIIAAQAQKHVTHNEAIRGLDALVQLMVLDKDLTSPPGSPPDGARYVVGAGGAWSGEDGRIAAWQDGAWSFYTPREGWLAWVADEDKAYVYTGSSWAVLVVTALGYTPANKAGDTFTGAVSVPQLNLPDAGILVTGTAGNYPSKIFQRVGDAGRSVVFGFDAASRRLFFNRWDYTTDGYIENLLHIGQDGTVEFVGAAGISVGGVTKPQTDNAYTLGASGKRWSEVYAATGTINTSDQRHKTDIVDSPLGLDFVLSLKPRAYRWLEGGTRIEWVEEPDADEEASIGKRKVRREVKRAGERTHHGLLAQEVKAALEVAGAGDFAGWVLADKTDAQSQQGLRYDQFIAPLVKAVQELAGRVAALEGR